MTTIEKKHRKGFSLQIIIVTLFFLGLAILFIWRLKSQEEKVVQPANDIESVVTFQNGIEDLPEDFPAYKNTELVTSSVSDDKKGLSFIWETQDGEDLVFEYLKSELRVEGWTLTNESSIGDSYAISFEKGNYSGFLGVFKGSGGKSIVSVTISIL